MKIDNAVTERFSTGSWESSGMLHGLDSRSSRILSDMFDQTIPLLDKGEELVWQLVFPCIRNVYSRLNSNDFLYHAFLDKEKAIEAIEVSEIVEKLRKLVTEVIPECEKHFTSIDVQAEMTMLMCTDYCHYLMKKVRRGVDIAEKVGIV